MGNTGEPTEETQDGDAVTADVSESASEAQPVSKATPDVEALLAEAEAEAAEAEAAALAARAKVRAMRSEDDEAPEEDDDEPARRLHLWPPSIPVVAKIVAAIVIVASLAGSGWILWEHHQASQRDARAAEFAAAASKGITAMTSLDYRHAKEDVQRIIDSSTGSFRDDYEVRADDFVKVVEKSKVIARGSVTATAVQRPVGDDEAVVLVASTQEVANAEGNKAPRTYRFRVTVTRVDGQLKMAKAEFVP